MAKQDIHPIRFEFKIGGIFSNTDIVKWSDGQLIYESFAIEEIYQPTPRQWKDFWKELNEIRVWNWKQKYFAPILDGTQWELIIEFNDKIIESNGSNCYPILNDPTHGEPGEQTEAFRRLLDAISKLMDGKTIR